MDEPINQLLVNRCIYNQSKILMHLKEENVSLLEIFHAKTSEKLKLFLGNKELVSQLERKEMWNDCEKEYEYLLKHTIRMISFDDPNYPELLRQIDDPPMILYSKGSLEKISALCLSMVGSRACTAYGKRHAFRLSKELAEYGFTIVSGLAVGIDSKAHTGALEAKGLTIGVVAHGLDYVYPKYNQPLYELIGKSGAVISEFPIGIEPLPAYFPRRNRIISGLSLGTIVVEARERSGSLITARLSLSQNRDVFALPGTIDSELSTGAHRLIQAGAKLITSAKDIINELPEWVNDIVISHKKENVLTDLSEIEKSILECLKNGIMTGDEILHLINVSVLDSKDALLKLELKGLIQSLPGNQFMRT